MEKKKHELKERKAIETKYFECVDCGIRVISKTKQRVLNDLPICYAKPKPRFNPMEWLEWPMPPSCN